MRKDTREDWERRAERVVTLLAGDPEGAPGLEEAASEAAASPWHFHRRFREVTGESFAACLRRLRLERASYGLREGRSVMEVALEAGFSSPEAFSRAYSRAFQLSPSATKALPAWAGELAAPNGLHWRPRREPLWFMPKAEGQVMETRISDLGAMRAFGFSGTEDAWELPALWRKLRETMQGRGGPVEAGRFLSIFMPDGRFAAAFLPPVGMELPGASGLEGFALAGGIYAIIPHFGPCEAIGPFWDLWEEGWLPGSGWELDPARPKLEWYQGHPELLGAELSLALLCDPVRKRGS
jgi:AraC family transcriptional regulator